MTSPALNYLRQNHQKMNREILDKGIELTFKMNELKEALDNAASLNNPIIINVEAPSKIPPVFKVEIEEAATKYANQLYLLQLDKWKAELNNLQQQFEAL